MCFIYKPHHLQKRFHNEVLSHKLDESISVLPGGHPPERDSHQPRGATVDEVVLVPTHVSSSPGTARQRDRGGDARDGRVKHTPTGGERKKIHGKSFA